MRDKLIKLIEAASLAPSADNIQPWQFRITGENKMELIFKKEEFYSSNLHNINYFADYISIGAAIENISRTAMENNLDSKINFFPEKECMAEIEIAGNGEVVLDQELVERKTNRGKYRKSKIPYDIKIALKKIAGKRGAQIEIVDGKEELENLAKVLSCFDIFLWENKETREKLLEHINFPRNIDKKSGISIDALELGWRKKLFELSIHVGKVFPLLWKIVAINAQQYTKKLIKNSGGVFLLSIPGEMSPENFLEGGRIFQREWLYLSKAGISIQPLFGALDFWYNKKLNLGGISSKHEKIKEEILLILKKEFPSLEGNIPIALGRMGYAEKNPNRSKHFSAADLLRD